MTCVLSSGFRPCVSVVRFALLFEGAELPLHVRASGSVASVRRDLGVVSV